VILVALGWLILMLCSAHVDLIAAGISAFLVVGPLFGAGFYELSRLRDLGQTASFDASLEGAVKRARPLARLGLVLALLALAWVMVSSWLFERAFGAAVPTLDENFYRTVLDWGSLRFFASYLATGALFALAAFVLSAVAAPMIFERDTHTANAILTSIKACLANFPAMILWAAMIAMLTAVGFATFLFGLIVVLPVLGHATWHAYRDLVR
jgi:uncharacterized membrane protein